jgi:hypothetical protein
MGVPLLPNEIHQPEMVVSAFQVPSAAAACFFKPLLGLPSHLERPLVEGSARTEPFEPINSLGSSPICLICPPLSPTICLSCSSISAACPFACGGGWALFVVVEEEIIKPLAAFILPLTAFAARSLNLVGR